MPSMRCLRSFELKKKRWGIWSSERVELEREKEGEIVLSPFFGFVFFFVSSPKSSGFFFFFL